MEFQYCSDLHLEFSTHSIFFRQYKIKPSADILLLAGDISYLRKDFYQDPFFNYISENWKATYWLPGNHEFYCGIDMLSYKFSEPLAIRKNVFLLNNHSLFFDDIQLIFSTLWSKIDMQYRINIENRVSDFEHIIIDNQKLSALSYNSLHDKSFSFIQDALKHNNDGKNLIITHHLPSYKCNHADYEGSKLNSAFISNLDAFIETCGAQAWIYGHSHKNMPEIRIGKTRLITNQFGYISYNEHKNFVPEKTIRIL